MSSSLLSEAKALMESREAFPWDNLGVEGVRVERRKPVEQEVLGRGFETPLNLLTLGHQFGVSAALYCAALGLQFIVASQERPCFISSL